jgi:parallel beta-helix repeat protein
MNKPQIECAASLALDAFRLLPRWGNLMIREGHVGRFALAAACVALLLSAPASALAGYGGGALGRYGGKPALDQTPPPEFVGGELQRMVDAASPGSVVSVPPGIYRETVTITKALTLAGQPGAEIRGSDVWGSGWERRGERWYHPGAPDFGTLGEWCRDGSDGRCNWPEQVFLDGLPLLQVREDPAPGQFAVSGAREIVLADDPTGRLVEVTARRAWLITASDGVTIQGFTMRHAADNPGEGALSNGLHSNWTVRDSRLHDAHGAVISVRDASNITITNNEISHGGRMGIHSWSVSNALISGNVVHGNNTEQFESGWSAGGMKLSALRESRVVENEVRDNDGAGIWCDVGCAGVTIQGNRVHHNLRYGILYEISSGGVISNNRIWENGWGFPDWGFGGGVVCQNCRDTEIAGNIVAWNADGISIMSQMREGHTDVVNISVHDNAIFLMTDWSQNTYMLAWLEDWAGRLTDPGSNNSGAGNRYFHAEPGGAFLPFTWGRDQRFGIDDLAGFNATPGEEGGVLLGHGEAVVVLDEAGIPAQPDDRPEHRPAG